jgi:hypothetical protein
MLYGTYGMANGRTTFNVGGNASTYYPVIFNIGGGATSYQYCSFIIERGGYDDPGYSGIGFSNMHARFSMTSSGWGFGSDFIAMDHYKATYNAIAKWYQEYQSSRFVIWLRGATRYNLLNIVGNTSLSVGNTDGSTISTSYGTYTATTSVESYATRTRVNDGSMWQDGQLYVANDIYATGNVTAYSDEKVKYNWRDLGDDFIEKLSNVKHGIYDRNDINLSQVGVSAQSLQQVLPEAVVESEMDGLSVAYGHAALAAVVELAKEVVQLRQKIKTLESNI